MIKISPFTSEFLAKKFGYSTKGPERIAANVVSMFNGLVGLRGVLKAALEPSLLDQALGLDQLLRRCFVHERVAEAAESGLSMFKKSGNAWFLLTVDGQRYQQDLLTAELMGASEGLLVKGFTRPFGNAVGLFLGGSDLRDGWSQVRLSSAPAQVKAAILLDYAVFGLKGYFASKLDSEDVVTTTFSTSYCGLNGAISPLSDLGTTLRDYYGG